MQNIKTNYDTIKEIQFRGQKDESRRYKFGIGISQYRCIICGEKRKDIDDNGICEDCLKEFPIKNEENKESNFQNLSDESERIMSTSNDFPSILTSSISKLDEQLGKISSDISNAAKEKQFDEISKLSSDAKYINDIQTLLNKVHNEYENRFVKNEVKNRVKDSPTPLSILIENSRNKELVIDPNKPPNLNFTKIIEIEIENESPKNWSNLIRSTLKIAVKKGLDFNSLQKITSIHLRKGCYIEEGFKYEPTIDFSYQELDANKSWKNVFRIVKHLKIPIKIVLSWRQREGSAYPNRKGVIYWKP